MEKRVILFSELTFNSCLTYGTIRLWAWGNYKIKVGFVPRNDLNEAVTQAMGIYDLIIAIGYQDYQNVNPCWLEGKSQLAFLVHREDEQGGKFIIVPSKQKLEPKTVKLIKKIKKIANEQIKNGILVDLTDYFSADENSQKIIDYLNLQRRYFQAFSVVRKFYGEEEQIKLHNFFLSELSDETEDENQWIDSLIVKYDLVENKHQKSIPFVAELNAN
jgi:hypothetical protein